MKTAFTASDAGWATDPDPLWVTAAFDGGTCRIGEARRQATRFLAHARAEHGLPVSARASDLTQLVVSELVTNALKYAPGPILMDLRITGDLVEVTVWDSDPALPMARAAEPGRVGQHGLEIVMAVVESFEARREPVGKRITARIALTGDEPDGRPGHRTG
ncbi:ATP-binding protein [Streptomyces sp. NPDC048362]|uniref:ATP-binding protein n=1 Tax=Streptomyces sp. NPDC048362 TaxID=3365539 RepID=UPI0037236271